MIKKVFLFGLLGMFLLGAVGCNLNVHDKCVPDTKTDSLRADGPCGPGGCPTPGYPDDGNY